MGNPFAPKSAVKASKTKDSQEATEETATAVPETPKAEETVNTQENIDPKAQESKEEAKIEVPDTTIDGVLDWVGDDKKKAATAIEHEKSQPKPRKTLINKLEEV